MLKASNRSKREILGPEMVGSKLRSVKNFPYEIHKKLFYGQKFHAFFWQRDFPFLKLNFLNARLYFFADTEMFVGNPNLGLFHC